MADDTTTSEQTPETTTPPVEEKKRGGLRAPHYILGATGGVLGFIFGKKKIVDNNLKLAVNGEKGAAPKFAAVVKDVFAGKGAVAPDEVIKAMESVKKNPSLAKKISYVDNGGKIDMHLEMQNGDKHVLANIDAETKAIGTEYATKKAIKSEAPAFDWMIKDAKNASKTASSELQNSKNAVDGLKDALKDSSKVKSVEFKKAGEEFKAHVTVGKKSFTTDLKKLPEGHKVGKITKKETIEELFKGDKAHMKSVAADAEKSLMKSVKDAAKGKVGFKQLETGSKGKVVGLAVAGAVVLGGIGGAIFRSKHTDQVNNDRANGAEAGQARA